MLTRILIAMICLSAMAQAQSAVGLLSIVTGNVEIVRKGQTARTRARIADLIGPGDVVVAGANSEATFLFCPESRTAKIPAGTEVLFDAAGLQVRKGKLSDERKIPTCHLPADLSLSASTQLSAGLMRLRGSDLTLTSPSRTSIATLRPRFQWKPVDNATAYDLKVMDREENVLWKQSAAATQAEYPADAPALAWAQKYFWRVTARDKDDSLAEVGSYFQVLPQDKSEEVRSSQEGLQKIAKEHPDDSGPRLLLAFMYEENGMFDEAARLYGEVAARMGNPEWLQLRVSSLMNKLGWSDLK
jgi:hypothetical protein